MLSSNWMIAFIFIIWPSGLSLTFGVIICQDDDKDAIIWLQDDFCRKT
jgi:hypothetical protein